jgi:hypothetical protein
MIGIITCIRHPDSAKDFNVVKSLLFNTITTLENQTDQNFKLYIVCNKGSDISIDDRINVEIIWIDRECPQLVNVVDDETQEKQWHEVRKDKGIKYFYGLQQAYKDSMDYVMLIDADDYLHNSLVDFINKHKAEYDGIIVDKGYSYSISSKFLGDMKRFNKVCGTCNSFSMKILKPFICDNVAKSEAEILKDDFVLRILGSHLNGFEFIEAQRGRAGSFPFHAVIYLIDNGENDSQVTNLVGFPRLVNESIINNFSLASYEENHIKSLYKLALLRCAYYLKPKMKQVKIYLKNIKNLLLKRM